MQKLLPQYWECTESVFFEGNIIAYKYSETADKRNAIEGLTAKVKDLMHQKQLSGKLFVFGCRNHKIIKILYWHNND